MSGASKPIYVASLSSEKWTVREGERAGAWEVDWLTG